MKTKFFLLLTVLFVSQNFLEAQDPIISQAYSAPMILNPALAGSTGSGRLSGIVKSIGTDLDNSYKVYHFAYDQMFNKISSGIGLYYTAEYSFGGAEIAQRAGLNYSVPLNLIKEKFRLTPAIELAMQNYKYNFTGLADSLYSRKNLSVFDLGAGLLMNTKRLNFGLVGKHLTQPDVSYLKNITSNLPMRFSAIADYVFGKIDEKRSWKITPGVRYGFINTGSGYSDLQVSLSAIYHKFKFGVAYRESPYMSYKAASAMISYNGWLFKFRYALDLFTGDFVGSRPTGHEVTLLFNLFGKKKKDEFVEAPNFAF